MDRLMCVFVHRLVADAFIENDDIEHKTIVNHKDGDRRNNNKAINLEWTSPSGNSQHSRTVLNKGGNGRFVIHYSIGGAYIERFAAEAVRSLNIETLHGIHIKQVYKARIKRVEDFAGNTKHL